MLSGTSMVCGRAARAGATNLAARLPLLSTAGSAGSDVASALPWPSDGLPRMRPRA